jgi:hypothetical protein
MSLNKFTDNKIKNWLKIHASEIICPQGIKTSEHHTHTFEPPLTQDASNHGHFLSYNNTTKKTEWKPVSGADSLTFISTWNADTNTPSLQNGVGQKNNYYVVQNSINSTSTTTTIDGISSFSNNDWIIFNGTVWNKIDNQNNVKSVNGKVGTVVLSHNDLTDKGTLTHNEIETKLTSVDAKDTQQDIKIATLETQNTTQNNRLTTLESKDITQDNRITTSEGKISAIETKNTNQDTFLTNYGSNLDDLNAITQNMPKQVLGSTNTFFNNNIICNGFIQSADFYSTGIVQCENISNNDLPAVQAIGIASTTSDVTIFKNIKLANYTGTANAMMRLNTDGTIEKTPLLIDGASNNNISGVNILTSNSIASGNILNSSSILSPNITLGTFNGGTGSAGILDINSGNITNTGTISAITDNTKDIGTTSIKYKDIHIAGDIFVGGDQFGLSSKITDGQTLTTTLQNDLNVQKTRITTNETNITALQQFASPTEFVYNLSIGNLLSNAPVRDDSFSTLSEAKVFITKISQQTLANIFLSYTRSNPSLTEIKLDGTTTGTTTTQKYVDFRDSGGLPNNYGPNELYNITFDAGVNNTWEMKTITCNFEHSGSGAMYDRLGIQASSDGVTYQNVSLSNFYQSATSTPPWSISRTSTTNGYIFPVDQTNIANVTYNINSRFVKFYFMSDNSSQRAGWNVRMTASNAFHGSLLIKDVNTYNNTKYVIKGGAVAQNNGNDLEIKYESTLTSPLDLNFSGSIPLVNFTLPSGWTEIAKDSSQISLTGDINGSSLSVSGDINLNGNIYQNGVLFTGGGSSISGISSLDNGGGDVEISFTGTDYKTNGYLTVDTNGKIQVQPSIVVSNAEYDAIALKWTQERTNNNRQLVKIYLPQGVPVGQFDHTIHNVYILSIDPSTSSKQLLDVRFIGYQGSASIQELILTNVLNSTEIYNNSSTAHPNNTANANLKQHIINHFRSDFDLYNYPGYTVTSVTRVCVPSALVNNWTETDQFAVIWSENGGANQPNFHITSLLGSQNGYSNINTGSPSIPAGYTEIF